MWQDFYDSFVLNFIKDDRWKYLTNGLAVTLKLTFFAVLLGLVIGFFIAMVRSTYENTGKLKILNAICGLYLTVIRGTPVVVQLLIIYFVIFGSVRIDKSLVAIMAFGINSVAYQAEIFRSGIQSIPKGQFEAGRSLGFNYSQTMTNIIMPQAFKNVIPTGDIHRRLHRAGRPDQGRRHHPQPHLFSFHAADGGGDHLSGACHAVLAGRQVSGEEAEEE